MANDKSVAEIVEINKKAPCEKPLEQQIEIMEAYTETHRRLLGYPTYVRELACLRVLYPVTFRHVEDEDLVVGRTDALPVGFGCVTSIGGVGHYCSFAKLAQLRNSCESERDKERLNAIESYWDKHDTRSIFFEDQLAEHTIGKFVDGRFPVVVTARLSGTMLNYERLVKLGIPGMRSLLHDRMKEAKAEDEKGLLEAFNGCLDILSETIRHHIALCEEAKAGKAPRRIAELNRVQEALGNILTRAPQTLIEGIELTWLYTLMAGVVNYGRADVYLGDLLAHDLDNGVLSEEDALAVIKSFFKLIDARHTNVNGRIIVGGRNRPNEANADRFIRIAIRAVEENRTVEPQFTLRIYEGMNDEIYQQALKCIGTGCTYPMLLNDDVTIPQVVKALRVDEKTAEDYVPFGCGELVINHASVGTPNALLNTLKILNISLNGGIDPFDGFDKSNGVELLSASELKSYEDVLAQYKKLLHSYIVETVKRHRNSYATMAGECDFLFTSLLYDDCIERGASILKGGVRYLGGTDETYGNINAADSLVAIKKCVFEEKRFTLCELVEAMDANYEGHDDIRRAVLDAPKYGNDDEYADSVAVGLHEFICQDIQREGLAAGFASYNTVLINNQVNTEWGRKTSASPDGRLSGMFMNNGNNPQSGADTNGPTAMLNSLIKLRPEIHAGSVQNIKFAKSMFREKMPQLEALFHSYFRRGGSQLMVSVVDPGELEDALVHPDLHQDLLVRVGGFSARFVALEKDVQQEVLARTLNE